MGKATTILDLNIISCVYIYIYIYMSGGQNDILPEMDMAKVGGPLSVVHAFAQIMFSANVCM